MARPHLKVTREHRTKVRTLAGFGVPHEEIAGMVSIRSPKTLRKYFRAELAAGTAEANARVAQTLFQMATSGQHPATTIFWMKTRAHWSEKAPEAHCKPAAPTLIIGREVDDESRED